eukprot:CAMPEP_0197603302 /NCGR_PEP_ID=MMETSP1326-20131121/38953_1 /TAXON_ID=1155430 /ORGANISM="Genus nov. species nov., Strain RCC2288" /LENGTH=146 /DNA_ID=CAMNT_0043170789 /DNA_START=19 /DNA_END=455 /DNA_ORIENTATION=-
MIGFPSDVGEMLYCLDMCLPKGSAVHILAKTTLKTRTAVMRQHGMDLSNEIVKLANNTFVIPDVQKRLLPNGTVVHHHIGPPESKARLAALPVTKSNAVIIMATDEEGSRSLESDSSCITSTMNVHRVVRADIDFMRRRRRRMEER